MNLYEEYVKKENQINEAKDYLSNLENDMRNIKTRIYLQHKKRFEAKPLGKTTLFDKGFEVVYNRTEKISVLNSLIEKDGFESPCFKWKTVPEKKTLNFSKADFKKMPDDDRQMVEKYIHREMNKATMSVNFEEK